MKYFILCLALVTLSSACKTEREPQVSAEQPVSKASALKPIKTALPEAFWRASDHSLRENTEMDGQTSKLEEFLKIHQTKLIKQMKDKDDNELAIFHITDPTITDSFYEFTFIYKGGKWITHDARVSIKGQREFNYFSGEFLAGKDLKPYLEKELEKLLQNH